MKYRDLLKGYKTLQSKVESISKELEESKIREKLLYEENLKLKQEKRMLKKKLEDVNSYKIDDKYTDDIIRLINLKL
ncbi:hypothetical protein [Clostridium perfringens]|uniref:Uncharacterized protein n=1 Tax=Clostridium perfringens TaxID=1502 RepID=A0A140GS34_CLOPF|nr:hypothetical protein [Clostridium perfringens]AMN31343.1 hypothetical protein JFP838_pA0427 [Clostridium perfringens]